MRVSDISTGLQRRSGMDSKIDHAQNRNTLEVSRDLKLLNVVATHIVGPLAF